MNKYLEKMQVWFGMRGPRERIFLFILGLALIYFLFTIFLLNPLLAGKKDLKTDINSLHSAMIADTQQIDLINSGIKSGNLNEMITQQSQLAKKLALLQTELSHLKPELVSPNEISAITKSILNLQQLHVSLSNLKDSPPTPWNPEITDKADYANLVTGDIFQRDIQLQIQSDYFNTIEYLDRLEKLSENIYWDSLDYKVVQYPMADIQVKFHLLTHQKS